MSGFGDLVVAKNSTAFDSLRSLVAGIRSFEGLALFEDIALIIRIM